MMRTSARMMRIATLFGMLCFTLMCNPYRLKAELDTSDIIVLPKPPFDYYNFASLDGQIMESIKLKLSKSSPNNIVDEEEWLERYSLQLPLYDVPNPHLNAKGNIPETIPHFFKGSMLIKAIKGEYKSLLFYGKNFGEGRYMLSLDSQGGTIRYAFDFINYAYSDAYEDEHKDLVYQGIQWASEKDGILYVSHSHRTYASHSGGFNAYLTAINLEDGKVLWRSQPLVSNAQNFEIIGDTIVCGYGFTQEQDYIYQINRFNGKVYDRIKVKSGPEYIIKKGDEVYVRTYNTDYIFKIK